MIGGGPQPRKRITRRLPTTADTGGQMETMRLESHRSHRWTGRAIVLGFAIELVLGAGIAAGAAQASSTRLCHAAELVAAFD
jgi:hypothetical protein